MSDLKAEINADIKTAMKERNKDVLTTLRGLMAAIKQVEVDTREDVSQEGIKNIIQKEIKKRRDALEYAQQQSREDLIAQNNAEIALIQPYLGKQLSEDELKGIIAGLIEGGADNIGAVMKVLNEKHKGQFEGRTASGLIKSLLS